uniref:SURF6 domain-containing protein n=1 Tax=Rhabditophanes sp. KR3021 TaxID=114890 RepID=A0AC35U191_9BILA
MAQEVDEYFSRMCDLIPTSVWGFDEDTNKKVLVFKATQVDLHLTNKEKKGINVKCKASYARHSGVVLDKVSEILETLRKLNAGVVLPIKPEGTTNPQKATSEVVVGKKQKQRQKLSTKEKEQLKKSKKEKGIRNNKRKAEGVVDENETIKKSKEEEGKEVEEVPIESKLSFSKLKDKNVVKDKKLSKSAKKEEFKGRDFKALLKKVEKREEKIASIREKDPEKADTIEKDIKWKSAMKRAEGEKIKDNPQMLKAAAKRKEIIKESRGKKWDERKNAITETKEKKQDKREGNLKKRIDDKKDKKIAKAKKRGRVVLAKD